MRQVLDFNWLRFWIGLVAGLQALGWLLSLGGALGPAGYALGLPPLLFASLLAAGFRTGPLPIKGAPPKGADASGADDPRPARPFWRHLLRNGWLPRALVVVFLGSLITGFCYLPNNGDALAYRTPRVLNWLSAGRWHWVDTLDARFNTRTAAYEWVSAPLLAITGSDRLLPLISLVSYLLLPGLVFGVWRRLGVANRVAWWWMWLLPLGYGFALQAGGVLTDLFGAVFALAAVQLALVAQERREATAAAYSLLAAALMTGAKSSNLPLLLPWALAWWPSVGHLFRRPWLLGLAAVLAFVSSNAPTALINWRHCGDWTGLAAETRARDMIGHGNPGAYLLHNTGLLLSQNLNPPLLPGVGSVNRWIEGHLPTRWIEWVKGAVEDGPRSYRLRELPHEDFAGLGLPLTLAAGAWSLAQWRRRRPKAFAQTAWHRAIAWSPWIAFVVFAGQSGIVTAGRLVLPYYPLMLIGLLRAGGPDHWVRTTWWRWGAAWSAASTVFVCFVSPMRPWFPVMTVLRSLPGEAAPGTLRERVERVYEVHQNRSISFDRFLARLPAGEPLVGMVAHFQFMETPLWRPFGSRRVLRPGSGLSPAEFRRRGVRYVMLRADDVAQLAGLEASAWVAEGRGEVILKDVVRQFPVEGAAEWWLVRLPEVAP